MKWRPRVTYGGGVIFEPDYSMRLWTPSSLGIGGSDTSSAGVDEAYEIRRDRKMTVTVVFDDAQYADCLQWLEWAQASGQVFAFKFDRDLGAGVYEYTTYLDDPKQGDAIEPKRNNDYPAAWEVDVVLRSSNGVRMHVPLYAA